MTIMTRRAALSGIALLPATAATLTTATLAAEAPAFDYTKEFTAKDRLQHHLMLAAQAMDELAESPGTRWNFMAVGTAGEFDLFCRAVVFDQEVDIETGMTIEWAREVGKWCGRMVV